jgi:hypothetical protein
MRISNSQQVSVNPLAVAALVTVADLSIATRKKQPILAEVQS